MPTRRDFLGSTAAAVGAAALPMSATPAAARAPQGQAPALPPAIAALTSMRSQMVPITTAERLARIEKARRLMTDLGTGAIGLTGGATLRYFTGIGWGLSERMLAVVLPRAGTPFLVCPAFERDRAEEQIREGPLATGST